MEDALRASEFMKRILFLLCCLLLGSISALHAQPKRAIGKAAARAAKQSKQSVSSALHAAARAEAALSKAAYARRISPEKRQQLINDLFVLNQISIQKPLLGLQSIQRKYGSWDFCERFLTQYYERHFGRPTPDMAAFFAKVNALNSPDLQRAVALRMEELVQNKKPYLATFEQMQNPPFVRIIYLPELTTLTRQSFRPQDLVYNCEMNISPGEFIPLGDGREASTIMLEGTPWHIAGFAAGLDYLPELYRFLITDGAYNTPFNVIWDKSSQSLLLTSLDNSLQLRIARHEYNVAHRLHLHIYRLVPAQFTNAKGALVQETALLNISFPIENETLNPRVPLKDWFITFPVKKFLKDPNAHVIHGKIF